METFEAIAVSHNAYLWQFRLDDGTVRQVSVSASDVSAKKSVTTTSCDILGAAPHVGARYLLTARVVGGNLSISNIGGSITELIAAPKDLNPPPSKPAKPSRLSSSAKVALASGAVLVLAGGIVIVRGRKRRASAIR